MSILPDKDVETVVGSLHVCKVTKLGEAFDVPLTKKTRRPKKSRVNEAHPLADVFKDLPSGASAPAFVTVKPRAPRIAASAARKGGKLIRLKEPEELDPPADKSSEDFTDSDSSSESSSDSSSNSVRRALRRRAPEVPAVHLAPPEPVCLDVFGGLPSAAADEDPPPVPPPDDPAAAKEVPPPPLPPAAAGARRARRAGVGGWPRLYLSGVAGRLGEAFVRLSTNADGSQDMRAYCAHCQSTLSRTCRPRLPSAQGRPLGLLCAWLLLHRGPHSSADHPSTVLPSFEQCVAARIWVSGLPGGEVQLLLEAERDFNAALDDPVSREPLASG